MAKRKEAKGKSGKVTFNLSLPVSTTKNCYKVVIPGKTLGEGIRWNQALYFPGQRSGKGLRKFSKATVTVILEG